MTARIAIRRNPRPIGGIHTIRDTAINHGVGVAGFSKTEIINYAWHANAGNINADCADRGVSALLRVRKQTLGLRVILRVILPARSIVNHQSARNLRVTIAR